MKNILQLLKHVKKITPILWYSTLDIHKNVAVYQGREDTLFFYLLPPVIEVEG